MVNILLLSPSIECWAGFFGFLKNLFIYLVALGFRCCTQAFSSCSELGLLVVAVCRLLIALASLVAEHRL